MRRMAPNWPPLPSVLRSLQRLIPGVEEISAELSLALKSRFPETETAAGRDRFDRRALLGGEAQNLVLARPFGWQIAKTDYTHSVRQPAFNGRLDEIRR